MINGPLTLQTLAFFFFFLPELLPCAPGRSLWSYRGAACVNTLAEPITKDEHKTTESANFIAQVHTVKHAIWPCQDGAGRGGEKKKERRQTRDR